VIARRGAEPGTSPLDQLTAALADRDEAIVLDNCEHVIEAAAAPCQILQKHHLSRTPRRFLTVPKASPVTDVIPFEQGWTPDSGAPVPHQLVLQPHLPAFRTSRPVLYTVLKLVLHYRKRFYPPFRTPLADSAFSDPVG
jgi:hypothetical protein